MSRLHINKEYYGKTEWTLKKSFLIHGLRDINLLYFVDDVKQIIKIVENK